MAEPEAIDIAQLSIPQQEALQMYTSVTDQDISTAIPLLRRSEWNVQIAITKFFDGEGADPLEEARRQAETVPTQGRTSGILLDDFGMGSARYRGGQTRFGGTPAFGAGGGRGPGRGGWRPPLVLAILFSPFTIVYRILAGSWNLILDLWRGPPPPTARARPPAVIDSQRREQEARQNLLKEQESAYEKSLRMDREKLRLRKEEESKRARDEQLLRDREQWRRWRKSTLMPEPGPEIKDATRLSIRMQDGERLIRRFASDASIDDIYAYVECHGIDAVEKTPLRPAGYIHMYNFKLVQTMPRAVFEADSGTIARIGRSANLIVEPTEEDDNDNDNDNKR